MRITARSVRYLRRPTMIKQVWVAVNPNDPQDIVMVTDVNYEHPYYFGDGVVAPFKPAMLIVEDEE